MSRQFKLVSGITLVGTCLGLLTNLWEARTALANLGSIIGAVLPVLALGGVCGGLTLIAGWMWELRPPSPEVRLRHLVPDLEWWVELDSSMPIPADIDGAELQVRYLRTKDALTELGVQLPHSQEDCVKLLVFATLGKLKEARKRFPLQPNDDGPVAID